ncbi:MAG TPA: extracellular solute-binding protein [Burkholderiales bacterium]|nr:extracellular solute-binding protein [Burkholderiales bacterium]
MLWSHFVPAYDKWYDQFAKDWGAANKVNVVVDHIPHLELAARLAAEISGGAGHDMAGLNGFGPHIYRQNVIDMTSLVHEMEKKYGKVGNIGRSISYDTETHKWPAFPDFYISFPGLYRKDLWDEIGMKPDTWEDLIKGGAKLKAKGHPIGIGLGHSQDPNTSWRSLMWCYGSTVQDKSGKHVTLNSKQTVEAIKVATAMYKQAMTSEVLSWDDASNNRYIQSGRASWIHNPISAYRTTQKSNPETADKIFLWKTPAGPVRRIAAGQPNCYVVWKFSRNQEAAKEYLRYFAAHYKDAFAASEGYNHPMIPGLVPAPMPFFSNDPTSHPSDKLKVLETAIEWNDIYGYPGPDTPQVDEVANNFIIPDMMANAATGKMTPEEAMKWAEKEIKAIYAKWNAHKA